LVVGEDEIEDVVEGLDPRRALHPGVERRVDRVIPGETGQERRPAAALVDGVEVDDRGSRPGGEDSEGHRAVADRDAPVRGRAHTAPRAPGRATIRWALLRIVDIAGPVPELRSATSGPCSPPTGPGGGATRPARRAPCSGGSAPGACSRSGAAP